MRKVTVKRRILSMVLALVLIMTCALSNASVTSLADGVISAGTMAAHPNGYSGGIYFTMQVNADIPYGTDWSVRYKPTTADAIQRIRGGVTTNVGNTGAETFVKYSETDWFIENWAIGGDPQDGDVYIVNGQFANASNGVTFSIDTTYIEYSGGVLTFTVPAPSAGSMKLDENHTTPNTDGGFYFKMDINDVPYNSDWSVRYKPETADAIQRIRGGVTSNAGNTGGETLVKVSETEWYVEGWTIGGAWQDGDILVVDGIFENASNGARFQIDKTYILYSGGVLKFSKYWPLTVELGNMQEFTANSTPDLTSGNFNFTLTSSEYIPYDSNGISYYPMNDGTIQRIRNGATTEATNKAAGTLVKYTDTQWMVPGWTIGTQSNQTPWQDGDIFVVEGTFNSATDGSGVTFNISKTYIYYKNGTLTFSTTMPETAGPISAGTMSVHSSKTAPQDGVTYFTMVANSSIPSDSTTALRYTPTTADAIQRIRNGETTNVGNTGAETLCKTNDTEWFIANWAIGGDPQDGDVYIVNGTFTNAAKGVTFVVEKSYILYYDGVLKFSTTMPEIPQELSLGTMSEHASGYDGGGFYFTLAANADVPYGDWSVRYTPVKAGTIQLIRGGVTTDVTNTGAETLVKFGETDWHIEAWAIGGGLTENGDVLIVEGAFTGNDVTFTIEKTYVLYYNGALIFSTTMPEIPQEINAGTMKAHSNGYNENGIYFTMDANEKIAYNTDWSVLYTPVNAGTIVRIRDGVTTDVTNTGAETLVKYSETEWFLQGWATQYSSIQDGDILKISGEFYRGDVTFTVETSYILYSGGKMLFYDNLPKVVETGSLEVVDTNDETITVTVALNIAYAELESDKLLANTTLNGETLEALTSAGYVIVSFVENASNEAYPTTMVIEITAQYYKQITDFAIRFTEDLDYSNGTVNYTGGAMKTRWIEVDGRVGLSSTDLVHLLKDVKNLEYSDAADINQDASVDKMDGIWLRKIIIGYTVDEVEEEIENLPTSGKELTIGVWNGSYHSFGTKDLNILDAAGMNLIIGVNEAYSNGMSGLLDKAGKVGIDVIADLRNWDKSTIPEWSQHNALRGFLMWDEPCATNVSDLKSLQSSFNNTTLASKEFYLNLLPQAASNKSLYNPTFGDFWGGLVGYDYDKDYLYKFTDGLTLQTLAFDSYGLLDNNTYIRPTYYSTFEILANTAKEKGIPLQYSLCSAGHNSTDAVYTTPTEAELRWQMALGLTFGAKELVHYTYTSDASDYATMVEYGTWETTELYDAVKEVNQEYLAWDDVYLNYEWQSTLKYDVGSTNNALKEMTGGSYSGSAATGFANTQDMLVGCFEDTNGNEAFMITNAGQVGSTLSDNKNKASFTMTAGEVTVTFATEYDRVAVIRKGETTVYLLDDSNAITLPVDAFDGIFVVPLVS